MGLLCQPRSAEVRRTVCCGSLLYTTAPLETTTAFGFLTSEKVQLSSTTVEFAPVTWMAPNASGHLPSEFAGATTPERRLKAHDLK